LINTWADSIRFGTIGERPLLQEVLAAVDLGDWTEVLRIRSEILAKDPDDPFLLRLDRLLHAAHEFSFVPLSGEDWSRGNILYRMGDYAEAEAKYRRAIHHRDLPGNEVVNTLLNMATCNDNLKRPGRAEHLRKLAAAWDAKLRGRGPADGAPLNQLR
jgi:tetratricopeptide (TPR) repeat protein